MRLRYLLPLFFGILAFAAPIRVSLPPLLGALPVAIAEKLGLFSEQGIEVELVPLPSQRDRILAFQAGQIEALVTDLTSAILLVASNPKEAAIAAALFLPPQDGSHLALITPANYSRIYSLAELVEEAKKRRVQIAIPRQSDLEFVLDQLFSQHGFSYPPEFYVGQDNLLINATWTLFGMTAAAVLPQPYVDYLLHYEFEGKPTLLVLSDFAGLPIPPDVLVVRRSLSPEARARFLAALAEAVARIHGMSREELVELAMPLAIDLFFPGVNLEAAAPENRARVEAAVDALRIPKFTEPSSLDPGIFELVASWAQKKGYLPRTLSYGDAVLGP
jgi:ABC-type nitrate/sulfonate/bicarbonate transport system substrate-binding protein